MHLKDLAAFLQGRERVIFSDKKGFFLVLAKFKNWELRGNIFSLIVALNRKGGNYFYSRHINPEQSFSSAESSLFT